MASEPLGRPDDPRNCNYNTLVGGLNVVTYVDEVLVEGEVPMLAVYIECFTPTPNQARAHHIPRPDTLEPQDRAQAITILNAIRDRLKEELETSDPPFCDGIFMTSPTYPGISGQKLELLTSLDEYTYETFDRCKAAVDAVKPQFPAPPKRENGSGNPGPGFS